MKRDVFIKKIVGIIIVLFSMGVTTSCVIEEDPALQFNSLSNWIKDVPAHTDGGYLFAFITKNEYYRLHYALSRDGYNWSTLNNGGVILDEYRGHPDICMGPDSIYRMIGVFPTTLWESKDLINWTNRKLPDEVFSRSNEFGYYTVDDIGAPKIFYDTISSQYIITWHACRTPNNNDWSSMKTLYVLTNDFTDYSFPEFLFNLSGEDENICTIDNIIRYADGAYYAIVKDERDLSFAPKSGKTIRISKSETLTGPYTILSDPITPVGRFFEAPILFKLANDLEWALLAEDYEGPEYGYHMYVAKGMYGPWEERRFNSPYVNDGTTRPLARHGCVVRIHEKIYQGLIKEYQ